MLKYLTFNGGVSFESMTTKVLLHSIHWLLVVIAVVLVVILSRFIQWIFSPLRKLPGPKTRCLPLGSFPELLRSPRFEPQMRWWKEVGYGDALIHFTILFWRPHLLILDKEINKLIVTSSYGKDSIRFGKRTQGLKDAIGNGLVTVQGKEWTKHRRILQPAFNTSFLREAMTAAVPFRVRNFIKCWKAAADTDLEIDVGSHIAALTLDIIGDVAFSHAFNALDTLEVWSKQVEEQQPDDRKEIMLADLGNSLLGSFNKVVGLNIMTLVCLLLNVEKLNWYINPSLRSSRRFLDAEVDKIVAKARKDNTKSRSLLHLLLHARDPQIQGEVGDLTDSDLRDEVKTFMIAGYETTSTWLHWAIYALVKYPDVQERVHEEVLKFASADGSDDINFHQLDKMEYFNAFLQEVLRMYPPIGSFVRYNTNKEKWHGTNVPPDTRIIVSVHLMHRHPKYWDDPDTFLPERWINVSSEEAERRRFAFIPFSAGGRNCIGQKFATVEAKLILAPLIRSFRFVLAPSQRDSEVILHPMKVTLRPKQPIKISIKSR